MVDRSEPSRYTILRRAPRLIPRLRTILEIRRNVRRAASLNRFRHYKERVKTFREQWLAWFHPMIFQKDVLQPSDYDRMPTFHYADVSLAESAMPAVSGLAALAAAAMVLVFGAAKRLG